MTSFESARAETRATHIEDARGRRASKSDWRQWARSLRDDRARTSSTPCDLSSQALHVAKHLALYADADGYAYPGHGRLARETGYSSEATIARAVKELAHARVIRYEPGRGRQGSRYWLLPQPWAQPGNPKSTPASTLDMGSGDTRVDTGVDPESTGSVGTDVDSGSASVLTEVPGEVPPEVPALSPPKSSPRSPTTTSGSEVRPATSGSELRGGGELAKEQQLGKEPPHGGQLDFWLEGQP